MRLVPGTLGTATRRLEAGGFVLIESAYAPGATLPPHAHDEAFLSFPVRGSFTEAVGTTRLSCETFDVIARPAGAPHTNRYDAAGASCVLIGIPPARLGSIDAVTSLFDAPVALPRGVVSPVAYRLARELQTRDAVTSLAVEGLVLELIAACSRRAIEDGRGAPSWLRTARDYIHEHWSDAITLTALAREAGVHPTSVARAFRRHLGCSAGEYARRLRIEHAKRQLASTNRPVVDIALEAGFYDHSHFGNVFRRQAGMTPAEYRAAFRQ